MVAAVSTRYAVWCSRRRLIRTLMFASRYSLQGFVVHSGRGRRGRGTLHVMEWLNGA